jgi:HTH-type transcriptional regulator/antitoxin HipB
MGNDDNTAESDAHMTIGLSGKMRISSGRQSCKANLNRSWLKCCSAPCTSPFWRRSDFPTLMPRIRKYAENRIQIGYAENRIKCYYSENSIDGRYAENRIIGLCKESRQQGGRDIMEQVARTPKQLGNLLRERRTELHLTQKELASRVGLRQSTVSALETSAAVRTVTLLSALAALDLEMVVRPRTKTSPQDIEALF